MARWQCTPDSKVVSSTPGLSVFRQLYTSCSYWLGDRKGTQPVNATGIVRGENGGELSNSGKRPQHLWKQLKLIKIQWFHTVGWVSKKLSDEVLAWLSVWSEVQIVCIWSSWCHCIPEPHHLLPHSNPNWFYFLVPAYPVCPGKGAVKWPLCPRQPKGCNDNEREFIQRVVISKSRTR